MVRGAGRVRSGRGGTGPTAAPPRVPPAPTPRGSRRRGRSHVPGPSGRVGGGPPPPAEPRFVGGRGARGGTFPDREMRTSLRDPREERGTRTEGGGWGGWGRPQEHPTARAPPSRLAAPGTFRRKEPPRSELRATFTAGRSLGGGWVASIEPFKAGELRGPGGDDRELGGGVGLEAVGLQAVPQHCAVQPPRLCWESGPDRAQAEVMGAAGGAWMGPDADRSAPGVAAETTLAPR